MGMESAIRAALLADAGVTAITTTVQPYALWRTADLPGITYVMTSGDSWHTYDGIVDYHVSRIQITCNARTYAQAKLLTEAALAALDGYSGIHDDVEIGHVRLDNVFDQPSPPVSGQEIPIIQTSAIFNVLHRTI